MIYKVVMNIADAIELEQHFTNAHKALVCAKNKMVKLQGFENTISDMENTINDCHKAAKVMQQIIKDFPQCPL